MARYWVNLGNWDAELVGEEGELAEKYHEADGAVCGLGNSVNKFGNYVYKTNNREDAEDVAEEARKAVKKIFGESDPFATDMIEVSRQPECPECGELGRFSDSYCSCCGCELVR